MSTQASTPPINHAPSDSINGRNPVNPILPTAMNGNSALSSDHKRNPSMTVTPAGATTFNANGAPQNKANIQFGSVNNGSLGPSSAMSTPQMAHAQSNSLGVNNNFPARMPSPSPSPIPQPVQVSGGRPPSDVGVKGNIGFGNFPSGENTDVNAMSRTHPQMQLNEQHLRRSSQQSMHADLPNHSLPTGPGRGGYSGRGQRGGNHFNNAYGGHGGHGYGNSQPFRPNNHNNRGSYQQRGGHNMQHNQSSPYMQQRTPIMNNVTPGTPQQMAAAMHMNPGMQNMQYGYQQYPAYGQVPISADPSISYNAQQNYQNYQQFAQYGMPPQSPRPTYNQPGYGGYGMQQTYSNQGQMPAQMSRQSSQISNIERPGSSIGQTPQTPASVPHHASARAPSVSGERNFIQPQKKSAAIVIKNAQGETVDLKKLAQGSSAAAATATPAPAASSTPTVPTPPSRTGSAIDPAHTRTESQTVKTDQEDKKKAMQEAVARKIAEEKRQEEEEKLRKAKEAEEEKAQIAAEAAAAAEREAAAKKEEAERLEREAKEAAEAEEKARIAEEEKLKAEEDAEKAKAAEAAKAAEKESAPAANDEDDEFERMIAEMEREQAEKEAEDARREEEYSRKKAAQKEAERKQEEEAAAEYEANMKELERKAEEEELLREKKRNEVNSDDEEAKRLFENLKAGGTGTSLEDSPVQTPGESGTNTPVSEVSMGPPAKSLGPSRRGKPTELTLDTKKTTEPPEPSATLKALTSARRLEDLSKVSYPKDIVSPNPALNANAPADRKFKYNKEFLLQFQNVFREKPSLDWDQKIREALGSDDSARPQTARTPAGMGARSASGRGPPGNQFTPMGNFGTARTLPPGTSSEQRFAASNAAMRGAPMAANPFAFGRPGSMGPAMARTPSNNPLGQFPGSPKVGGASRGASRNESKRNKQSAKQEQETNKSMPLTAGMQIGGLETSATGWKPRSIGQTATAASQAPGPDGYMEADVVQRKVKAALNKMTPEKFDRISDQILDIAAQSKQETDGRTLRQVIQLVFEKATDEAHWAPMYAKFCYKMLSNMSNDIKDEGIKDKTGQVVAGGNLFRKYLLNRCQEEFEQGWKINLPAKKEGETEEAAMLSEEYYKAAAAKRRGLGLVKFIGELFKLGMLTERIMHECVKKLLDYEGTPDDAEVESLSSLLRTIGKQLDSHESKAVGRMDVYFERIHQTMNLPDLPSRLKFMLMDIVDLRKSGWQLKDADKGPKTIQQIHEEAEAARQQEELNRITTQANARGGGRMPMGRGDARSFSGHGQIPPPDNSNRVGVDDLRRLGGSRSQRQTATPSGMFGPSGLGARTNSGRRGLGPALRPDDSSNNSRTGTPPANKDAKKDESSNNAFSALAALEGAEGPTSPPSNPSSPPTQKSHPSIDRERSRSPEKQAD